MSVKNKISALAGAAAMAAVAVLSAGSAFGAVQLPAPEEKGTYAGTYRVNLGDGTTSLSPGAAIVYDANNVVSGSSWVKATAGNRIIGDYVTPIAGGTLSDFTCSIFNSTSGGNTGAITGVTVTVNFSDFDDNGVPTTSYGGFSTSFTFDGTGLAAGFFSLLSTTGLETLTTPIVLPSTEYLVTTQFVTTGASLRQGFVTGGAASVGFSDFTAATGSFFQSGTGVPAGAYAFSSNVNNPVFQVATIVPEPSALGLLAPAGLLLARRRRA